MIGRRQTGGAAFAMSAALFMPRHIRFFACEHPRNGRLLHFHVWMVDMQRARL